MNFVPKILLLLDQARRSLMVQNIIFSGLVQAVNMLTPVVVAPYLTHTIGLEKFGIVNFVWAFTNVMLVFIDFGFNLTAVRRGSLLRHKKIGLSYLFSRVVTLRILLAICCMAVMIGITYIIEKANTERAIFLSGTCILLGYAFHSFWFFQAIEQMKIISWLNVFSKISFVISLWWWISTPQDYIFVPLLMGISNLLGGITGIFLIYKKHQIRYHFPSLQALKNELKEGIWILASNFSIAVYINAATIFIGVFLNDTILGAYSLVEKITLGIRQITGAVHNAIYPRICLLVAKKDFSQNIIYRKVYFPYLAFLAVLLCGMFLFRVPVIEFFANGQEVALTVYLLQMMLWIPLVTGLDGAFYLNLLAHRKIQAISVISIVSSLVNVFLIRLLIPTFGITGVIATLYVTSMQVMLSFAFLTEIKHKELSIFRRKT